IDGIASVGKIVKSNWGVCIIRIHQLDSGPPHTRASWPGECSAKLSTKLPEVASALALGEKLHASCSNVLEALALIIRKEEQLVLNDRPSERAAELVIAELRLETSAVFLIAKSAFECRYAFGH